ncbi:YbaB/EbfC family nucleoid-associated protein [Candidatus Margulisiibacteriota bacterium]
MLGDIGKMMKQVNEMKSKMKDVEKELKNLILKGSSQDNTVEVEMSGKMELKSIKIDPQLITSNDVKKIEKNTFDAVQKSLKMAKDTAADKLGKVTGGAKLPGIS